MRPRCRKVVLLFLLSCPIALLLLGVSKPTAPSATFTHGMLSVAIPYTGAHPGSGRLIAEIIDPEDHVLGRNQRMVDITQPNGSWQQSIASGSSVAFEDVVWQRVRYRFEYADKTIPAITGVQSIAQTLRRPVVHLIGQTEYLAGSNAAIRVLVSDAGNNDSPVAGTVHAELLTPGQTPRLLFSGHLNRHGTVAAQFHLPAGLIGRQDIHVVADTPIGSAEYTQPIELKDPSLVMLTTEKPIYQPGQAIHLRALALNRSNHRANADRPLTFEIEDSRGNKVFRKSTATDHFGVASAEFSLADEVNLGTYHVRALMGGNTAEMALNVDRYVLPKFKVAVDLNGRYYRPGDHVTGVVHANYFFGKPVDRAETSIKISGMDVEVFDAASTKGATGTDGAYNFDLRLPAYFAGRGMTQGAARALVEATVKDSSGHAESRGEPITITQSGLLITAIPEGGTLIPHLENQVFVLSSYPDGTPASTSLTVHITGEKDQRVSTDRTGIATIHMVPGSDSPTVRVDADDHRGVRTTATVALDVRAGGDQVLLRPNRSVLKVGDALQLKVLATRNKGAAYIDIVRNGQTVLTRDLDLQDGQTELTIATTPEMAGMLDVDAYIFGADAQPSADHRLIFVEPADELKIATTTDAPVYKPGADARICFRVTNAHGEGVSAALGLQVVDEAVFALAEKQPGFARIFFYLEQEVMKPRYEIHSLSLSSAINDQQDTQARALFAATEMAAPAKLDIEFGRSLPQDKYYQYEERYRAVFVEQVRDLAAQMNQEISEHGAGRDIPAVFHTVHPRDSWNTPLRIEQAGWGRSNSYSVRSAGPDGVFDSADDLVTRIGEHGPNHGANGDRLGAIRIEFQRDRGPMNRRAEVRGSVCDQAGADVVGATITLRQIDIRATRTTHTDADGHFALPALPPGSYRVEVSSAGFVTVWREITLKLGDRAVVTTTLSVAMVSATVMVETAGPIDRMGMVAGVAGGAAVDALQATPMERPSMVNLATVARGVAVAGLAATPHVRSFFPEALYINPEIITDSQGDAAISIPVADSITTWRMAMLASTASGALGSATSSLKVFQDFFVDLDLPVMLTQGDQVSVPVAVYNYSRKPGQVNLKLEPERWFSLDHDTASKTVSVKPGQVGESQFTFTTTRIGKFKLTLSAHMNDRDDIVVRAIEVIPNGREQDTVFNGRLESSVAHDLKWAPAAIADASSVWVRLYPGPLSQIMEGMDSILSMPGGCFEQTSSSTYPNVLALDYMKRTKKLTPETHAKAEGYIANGYQRLLTFEVPSGGFSWFGTAPANKILTAYGLMEFSDMAKVADVDPRLIERTRNWLVSQQQADGGWQPDTQFINEGATNRFNSDKLRITAYIAWALAATGMKGEAVDKAREYMDAHGKAGADPYTLAVIANFAAEYGHDREFTNRFMQALLDARTEKDEQTWWSSQETGVYSTGASATIETTGLATQALLKWGRASATVRKSLTFLSSKKEASGAWGTTQATIMALRALILATELSASDVHGSVQVLLDGKAVRTLDLTAENNDLFHQFVFNGTPASVELRFTGKGSLAYQVVGRSFIPWKEEPVGEPLSIHLAYDRTTMPQNDLATETVTIRNNLPKTANMIMVDLGIAPGFDLLSEDLQSLQEKGGDTVGHLEKFSLTATQAILYFNGLAPHQEITLKIRLRAKYPLRALTAQSRIYEYYDPEVSSITKPVKLQVERR